MNKKKLLVLGIVLVVVGGGIFVAMRNNGALKDSSRSGEKEVMSLPLAKSPETFYLQDGDTYPIALQEVQKEIDGKRYRMLAYNGSIPGPVLRVEQGSKIILDLKNDGDIPTTLHAHGVRMNNAFDGVPKVTQKEIAPGESFQYELNFPDAGVFWYHPHVRTDYTIESGLYANIIVTPKDKNYWPSVNREVALILDDIALTEKGLLPFDAKTPDHTIMGRFGNVMLVNGETNFRMTAQEGEVVRLYLTNAANTRLFNFAIPEAKMKLVGADGARYGKETMVQEVLLGPGERRVVDVYFEKAGSFTMKHKTPGKEYPLGTIVVEGQKTARDFSKQFLQVRTNQDVIEEMQRLADLYAEKKPEKTLRMIMTMNRDAEMKMRQSENHMGGGHMMENGSMMSGAMMGGTGADEKYEWEDTMKGMNTASNTTMMKWSLIDTATKKENMDIDDWKFSQGSKIKIRILNDPNSPHAMQHPIHFHGNNFMILSVNGEKNENPVWMDTALIPSGEYIDILLDASQLGKWMMHCHILEHAEAGMMLQYEVK